MLKLEAPWYSFANKLKVLFERDPDIRVDDVVKLDGGEAHYCLNIGVRDHNKFLALDRALPSIKEFGNVKLAIVLYDEQNANAGSDTALYETIFKGNPILNDIKDVVDFTGTKHVYVEFVPEVLQFFCDNLQDYNGNWSGIAEDIARDVFDNEVRGVHFCTADVKQAAKPAEKALG